MKVKIISWGSFIDLEQEINEFIKDKDVVDIKYQSFETKSENPYNPKSGIFFSCLILYKEFRKIDKKDIKVSDFRVKPEFEGRI